ncbi:MBL fold metallo-hydrolase [Streptomyces sp. NPDC041068]|uniref:MBL fold metallo-hydrolase n=1 Tax=Streptomyces sp. NPDC041068 TaxID=3155130 RepID=UPI0034003C98
MSGWDRRDVLRGAARAAALAGWGNVLADGGTARAAAGRRSRVIARRAGAFEVLALLDAHGPFPGKRQDHFTGATAADWERAQRIDPAAFGPDDTWELDFRCYAIRRPGGRVTLVDTGIGPAGSPASGWAPVPGHLPEVLREAGVGVGDVDTVVLTHLHEDHYGWAVGPDGTPMFPGARHIVQRREVASLGEGDSAMSYVVAPLRAAGLLEEVDGRTRLLGGGGRGGGGSGDGGGKGPSGLVTLVPTPGHTAGHQSVLVEGGSRRIMVTGDALVHAVQLANPAVAYAFERDKETARRSRERLLTEARQQRALLATAHLNRPFVRADEGRASEDVWER